MFIADSRHRRVTMTDWGRMEPLASPRSSAGRKPLAWTAARTSSPDNTLVLTALPLVTRLQGMSPQVILGPEA
jgi:hypothetical protein